MFCRLRRAVGTAIKHLALYGACGGVLIVAMRFVEYRFLVVSHSVEIYAALMAGRSRRSASGSA